MVDAHVLHLHRQPVDQKAAVYVVLDAPNAGARFGGVDSFAANQGL